MKSRLFLMASIFAVFAGALQAHADVNMGPEVTISNEEIDEFLPYVAYNSKHEEYLVVWGNTSSPYTIKGKRVSASGTAIETFTLVYDDNPARDNCSPSAVYDTNLDQYLVVWIHDYSGDGTDTDVRGQFVPWDGPETSDTSFSIYTATGNQWKPRVAYCEDQNEFMVTWWNEGSGSTHSSVFAQRVNPADPAFPLIGGPITVASDPDEDRLHPDIAYNRARNEYLITYERMDVGGEDIYGVRLDSAGTILGEIGIAAWPAPETFPRVTASTPNDEWAVIWQSERNEGDQDIYARRVSVDSSGDVQLTAPVHVSGTATNESYPDIAASLDETSYLMVFEVQYSNISGPYGIDGRILYPDNTMGTAFALRPVYAGETNDSHTPAAEGGPGKYFVAWEQERSDLTYGDILGRSVKLEAIFNDGFENGNSSEWSTSAP